VDYRDASVILTRDDFRCVRCGKVVSTSQYSIHHRVLGNRKDRRACVLITLCGSGTTGCHGWVHGHPAEAKLRGWIVSRFAPRTAVPELPVWYEQGPGGKNGWFLLGDDLTLTPGGPLAA
jgi:hypothetical protein